MTYKTVKLDVAQSSKTSWRRFDNKNIDDSELYCRKILRILHHRPTHSIATENIKRKRGQKTFFGEDKL